MKATIVETWHNLLGKEILVDTVVNIGDKIKFCDNKQFEVHLLVVTGINNYCVGIEAKDEKANRIYFQDEMLDLKVLNEDEFNKESEKYKNIVYRKVSFDLSDGYSVKL